MTTSTHELRLKTEQLRMMKLAFLTAELPEHYLKRVIHQPLTLTGIASRIQEAFGHGRLYTRQGTDLVFVSDPSIPSSMVTEALQAAALDRMLLEAVYTEAEFAARRHAADLRTPPELRHMSQSSTGSDFHAAYRVALRSIPQVPDYRSRVAAELLEIF